MSQGFPNTIVMAGVECTGCKARGCSMLAFSQMTESLPVSHGLKCNSSRRENEDQSGNPLWDGYIQILRYRMRPWARGDLGWNYIFVQDNATPRVAYGTVAFLDQHEVMEWPAMNRTMNPIQHVCDQMSVWIRYMDRSPTNLAELHQAIHKAWRAVSARRLGPLVESMPRRVRGANGLSVISNSIEAVVIDLSMHHVVGHLAFVCSTESAISIVANTGVAKYSTFWKLSKNVTRNSTLQVIPLV